MLYGILGNSQIAITIKDADKKKALKFYDKNGQVLAQIPVFKNDDSLHGTVKISIGKSKKLDHQGIRVELIGRAETPPIKNSDFISTNKELDPTGSLLEDREYEFSFNRFDKPFETYIGNKAKIYYFIKVTIKRPIDLVAEAAFAVLLDYPPKNQEGATTISLREDNASIDVDFKRFSYHMRDVIEGTVKLAKSRCDLKNIELKIVREECIPPNSSTADRDPVLEYEVCDGTPEVDEEIPFKIHLIAVDLSPSYTNVNNRFSVKYYLRVHTTDEFGNKYYKDSEINIWRYEKPPKKIEKTIDA